ncbi:hypothetical protein ACMD2_19327, partial [Ananas comosus]
TYEFLYVW